MTTLSTAKDTIRDAVISFNGSSYAGNVEEINLPDFALKTEEYRAGGMDTSISLDMGMDMGKISVTLTSYSPQILGLLGNKVSFVANMTLQSEILPQVYRQYVVSGYGLVTSVPRQSVKYGELAKVKVDMSLEFYKEDIDGETITLIDAKNTVRMIGGFDQLAGKRLALGL